VAFPPRRLPLLIFPTAPRLIFPRVGRRVREPIQDPHALPDLLPFELIQSVSTERSIRWTARGPLLDFARDNRNFLFFWFLLPDAVHLPPTFEVLREVFSN